jgi:predicted RNA-binding protein
MGDAVRSHLQQKDTENGTITKIEMLKALSYEKIPDDKRKQPDEAYLCKVYIRGTWSYGDSYRIYNMDDTLKCYFNSNKVFLRIDDGQGD